MTLAGVYNNKLLIYFSAYVAHIYSPVKNKQQRVLSAHAQIDRAVTYECDMGR